MLINLAALELLVDGGGTTGAPANEGNCEVECAGYKPPAKYLEFGMKTFQRILRKCPSPFKSHISII